MTERISAVQPAIPGPQTAADDRDPPPALATPPIVSRRGTDAITGAPPAVPGAPAASPPGPSLRPPLDPAAERARVSGEVSHDDEARKPSFFRTVLEIAEFVGRFFMPFVNLISACIRIARVVFDLFSGKQVDWAREGVRLMGDIAGIFFPPIGALVAAGANVWWNESELLGGVNKFFDEGEVQSSARYYYNQLFNRRSQERRDLQRQDVHAAVVRAPSVPPAAPDLPSARPAAAPAAPAAAPPRTARMIEVT